VADNLRLRLISCWWWWLRYRRGDNPAEAADILLVVQLRIVKVAADNPAVR
jgi:hypothetical protein